MIMVVYNILLKFHMDIIDKLLLYEVYTWILIADDV